MLAAIIGSLVAVELNPLKASAFPDGGEFLGLCIDHYRDTVDFSLQFGDPVPRLGEINVSLGLGKEVESQRIRTGGSHHERIIKICDATNLGPKRGYGIRQAHRRRQSRGGMSFTS